MFNILGNLIEMAKRTLLMLHPIYMEIMNCFFV